MEKVKHNPLPALAAKVFKSTDGQAFLDAWEQLYAHRRSFVQGDPHQTSFKEGQRDNAIALIELGRGGSK